jgi:uncharacterized protein YbjT (DUF2867 family)
MKVLVLGATGGTGRLIVRDAVVKGHSVVALVRSMARAYLPGAILIEGDARNDRAGPGNLDSPMSGASG